MSAIDTTHSHELPQDYGQDPIPGHEPHVMSIQQNLLVFGILLVLLVLTVAVALVDLGPFGLPIAMIIATIKAALILMYFMHVKFSPPLVWVFATAALAWLLILFGLTLNDYFTRAWMVVLGK